MKIEITDFTIELIVISEWAITIHTSARSSFFTSVDEHHQLLTKQQTNLDMLSHPNSVPSSVSTSNSFFDYHGCKEIDETKQQLLIGAFQVQDI